MVDRLSVAFLSLVLSLASLFALFYFHRCPEYSPAGGVKEGECVTVRGYVVDSRFTGKVCIYRVLLPSQAYVKLVDFGSRTCRKGYVCAEGRVQMWKGAPEVVVLRYC